MDESIGTSATEHRLTVASDTATISSLRTRIAELARAWGADDSIVSDLELAVSELATNVVQHSDSTEITVLLRHEPERWVLDVDDADGIDVLDPTTAPGTDALSGRGLFIVHAVMDRVEVVDDGHRRFLRCSKLVV